jgi:hypothetical protein
MDSSSTSIRRQGPPLYLEQLRLVVLLLALLVGRLTLARPDNPIAPAPVEHRW